MSSEFGDAAREIRAFGAEWGIVLGSGLGGAMDSFETVEEIPCSSIRGLPQSSVPGHSGRLALARAEETAVVVAEGRVHLYEGRSAAETTASIRFLAACGVRWIVLTNAAGSLRPELPPGSWMLVRDHLNLTGTSPLCGPRFVDLTNAYASSLRQRFLAAAGRCGLELREGIYAGLPGPHYETPAEVAMLRVLGADAVGMSTVLETIEARARGLEVAALSCITNPAAGLGNSPLDHREVLDAGRTAAAALGPLLLRAITGK